MRTSNPEVPVREDGSPAGDELAGALDVDPAFVRQRERLLERIATPDAASERGANRFPGATPDTIGALSKQAWLDLFSDQLRSRELDAAARWLRSRARGYYTIQSAGHEQNALLGALLRTTDPCLLHYRSGALMLARARKAQLADPIGDVIASFCASSEDPIAGGRHKVFGSRELCVPPQTSTIASHLPRATGLAFALARREASTRAWASATLAEIPDDSVVCCSFGDASAQHASALAAINGARYAHRLGQRTAILFVCEDNGLGISVPTPKGWIAQSFGNQAHLHYVRAEGSLGARLESIRAAIDHCRETGTPGFLHLECVRLFGHAGSDVEATYRESAEIESEAERDPLLQNAQWLMESGLASAKELEECVERARVDVMTRLAKTSQVPHLRDRSSVMAPLAPFSPARCVQTAKRFRATEASRRACFGSPLPEAAQAPSRRTLGAHIGSALHDAMLEDPDIWVFGEDVARKGGVYRVTAGLQERFGRRRVFDTLLDETSILGIALGASLVGVLPIPEIQYLAYLHNALDQLRGEACSLAYFSNGQFTNPMIVRVASFGYQKGFGGHFHNDNSIGALRDIPGLMLAAPCRGDDAVRMLRAARAIARSDGRVIAFLEPIALYHEKDLYAPGDEAWLSDYPADAPPLWPGDVGSIGDPDAELLIVTYANGVRMSLRAARRLEREHGIRARVLDLRWLAPLPLEAIERELASASALLVADECRATGGGVADAIVAHVAEAGIAMPLASVRSCDTYVPLGPAAETVLLGETDIFERALRLMRGI